MPFNINSIDQPIKISSVEHKVPVDALSSIGAQAYYTTVALLKDGAREALWNGIKVVNADSGLEYKLFRSGAGYPGALDDVWGYTPQPSPVITVTDVSTKAIVLSNVDPTAFGATPVVNKLYLVRYQASLTTGHLDNGIYIATSATVFEKYSEFTTQDGGSPTRGSFAADFLKQVSVYCLYNGVTYRAAVGSSGGAALSFYANDFINNGLFTPSSTYNSLALSVPLTITGLVKGTTFESSGASPGISATSKSADVVIFDDSTGILHLGRLAGQLNVMNSRVTTQVLNLLTGATTSGITKTLNIGTGGDAGSITNINIGPTGGLATINIGGSSALTIMTLGSAYVGSRIILNGSVRAGYKSYEINGVPAAPLTIQIPITSANVFYYDIQNASGTPYTFAISEARADLANYLGVTFCVTIRNRHSTSIGIKFNDDVGLFQFDSSSTEYTLAAGAAVSYTGVISGIYGTTTSYYLDGVLAPSYQNLL